MSAHNRTPTIGGMDVTRYRHVLTPIDGVHRSLDNIVPGDKKLVIENHGYLEQIHTAYHAKRTNRNTLNAIGSVAIRDVR